MPTEAAPRHRDAATETRPMAKANMTVSFAPGEWMELEPKELLRRLAVGNVANFTGRLDYIAGRTPHGSQLKAVTDAFCDNFLLRVAVPDYYVTNGVLEEGGGANENKDGRSKVYAHLGHFMKQIRRIMSDYADEAGTPRIDMSAVLVKPVPMTPFTDADLARVRLLGYASTVFAHDPRKHVEQGDKATKFFWQNIKVSCQDADLQTIIDLIRSGEFNAEKLYFKDFDTTIDCAGVFVRRELFDYLKNVKRFSVRGKKFKRSDGGSTLLDNEADVGLNCLTWMTTIRTDDGKSFRVRLKVYLKLVQELEKASTRANIGQHVWDWTTARDSRLAAARNATTDTGMTRAEITVYYDRKPETTAEGEHVVATPPFDRAYTELDPQAAWMGRIAQQAVDAVPAALVHRAPHSLTVANWVGNMRHTLVVYDARSNQGLVCYGFNEVTSSLSATHVGANWQSLSSFAMQLLPIAALPIDVITVQRGAPTTKPVLIRGQQVEKPVGVRPQAMPPWLVKKLGLKTKPLDEATGHPLPTYFRCCIDAEADEPFAQTDLHAFFARAAAPPAEEDVLEGNAAVEGVDPAASLDSGEENEEEEEDTASARGDDEAAEAETRGEAEAEAEAAQPDDEPDDGSDQRSVITTIIKKEELPQSCCALQVTRFQRFPVTPNAPLVTRFPMAGRLSSVLQVETVPDSADAATRVAVAARNEAAANAQLVKAGFRLPPATPDGEPLPVKGLFTELPSEPHRATKKLERFDLMQTDSWLPLNSLPIRPAKEFTSYRMWPTDRKGKKRCEPYSKWFGAILRTRRAKRQRERLASIAQGAVERPEMQELHVRTYAIASFKAFLKTAAGKPISLADLEPGTYPLVAVWRRGLSRDGVTNDHVLFLLKPGETAPIAAQSVGLLNSGLAKWSAALKPAFVGGDGGDFYFNAAAPSTTSSIGVLVRTADGEKKRKHDDADGTSGFVRPRDFGLKLQIGETVVAESDALKRATKRAEEEALRQHACAIQAAVPELVIDTSELAAVQNFTAVFPSAMYPNGINLKVLHLLGTHCFRRRTDVLVLEVRDVDILDAPMHRVWATPAIQAVAADLRVDSTLVVSKIMAKDVRACVTYGSSDWAAPSRAAYQDIDSIAKGKPDGIQLLRIDSVKSTVDRDGNERVVFRDTDGKLWRFHHHQHSKTLTLQPGYGINVAAWKPVQPASGAGCSTDPQ